jgi:hypothetical protein
MNNGVDNGLAQRLIWILGLIFSPETTNGRADPDVLA